MRVNYPKISMAAALLAAGVLAGCGENQRSFCAYVDAEGSTVRARPEYFDQLSMKVAQVAEAGRNVRVVVGTGAPLTEATVITADFAELTGLEQQPARNADRAELMSRIDEQTATTEANTEDTPGSAIAAGMSLVARNGQCGELVAYTDGLETADLDVYSDDLLTEDGRAALIDRLKQADRIPQLDGASVEMPFGGYLPQGSNLSKERQAALTELWAAWAKAAGGNLTWGR